ncbi:hypothetical protein BJX76DRAFT_334816 [Aspergillus varians]
MSTPQTTMPKHPSPPKVNGRKKRARPLPPHVVARNLAIEKRRREELNEDFVNLARLVPSLANVRRLSKVLIVNETFQHLQRQRDLCIDAARDMQELLAENSQLVAEVNALRSQMGGTGMMPSAPRPITNAMAQLMGVQDEVYGKFPAGFGDNWACTTRASPPSASESIPSDDGGLGLSLDGGFPVHEHHDTQRSARPGLVMLDIEHPGVPFTSPQPPYEQSDLCSSFIHQTTTSPTLYPDWITPITPPTEDYLSVDVPDYPIGLSEAGSLNPFMPSWTEGFDSAPDWPLLQHEYPGTG